jgi:hypothetical protein
MPRGDGTGPMGQGPMTGRGMGYCAGYSGPGYMSPGPGMGRGMGRGMGWRRFWSTAPNYGSYQPRITKSQESAMLKDEKSALEEELKNIKERLSEIESKK